MSMRRRDVILAGLGLGIAHVVGLRWTRAAQPATALPAGTYGVVPDGGVADQTAALQRAADAAALSGRPLFLAPGVYATSRIELKSGTHILGVPGRSMLRSRASNSSLLSMEHARDIRIDSLVLDGGAGSGTAALLQAAEVDQLDVSNCRFLGSSGDGLELKRVSGHVTGCYIGNIRRTAVLSEDPRGLAIASNQIEACGDHGILVWRSTPDEDCGALIADNTIDRVATGIGVRAATVGGRLAVVRGNRVRSLFFRKDTDPRGNGIAIDAGAVVSGNVIEHAPGFGIIVGSTGDLGDVSLTDNQIRDVHIGIGIPASRSPGPALAGNVISGVKAGAIRAMNGPTSTGADLGHGAPSPDGTPVS
jgi:Right handed beta helix region